MYIIYVYTHIYVCIDIYNCIYTHQYLSMYLYLNICISIHVFIYRETIYIYTYIYITYTYVSITIDSDWFFPFGLAHLAVPSTNLKNRYQCLKACTCHHFSLAFLNSSTSSGRMFFVVQICTNGNPGSLVQTHLSSIYLSIHRSIYLSIHRSIYLSSIIDLSIDPSIHRSIHPSNLMIRFPAKSRHDRVKLSGGNSMMFSPFRFPTCSNVSIFLVWICEINYRIS